MKELIRFENITYTTSTNREIFCDLSLSIKKGKIGIIGRNGVGKSLLAKLITGEAEPAFGKILRDAEIYEVPQIIDFQDANLLESIDVSLKNGTVDFSIKKVLKKININFYKAKESIKELSGGELRMLYIMNAFCNPADMLILDEPESDLDIDNRQLLREMILGSNKTIIIISHDRKTLDCVDNIMEIKEQGVTVFGGGYSQYLIKKNREELLLDRNIKQVSKEIDNIEVLKESVINNQKFKTQKAQDDSFDRGHSNFWCDTPKKDRAARTLKRLKENHELKMKEGQELLGNYLDRVRIINNIKIPFTEVQVEMNKTLVELSDIHFFYEESKKILSGFSMAVKSGEKIWLSGKNGSGKTTIINIVASKLVPQSGSIKINCEEIGIVDQKQDVLILEDTLLENIVSSNDFILEEKAREIIQSTGFPLSIATRKCSTLSGGERILASLIIVLLRLVPPEIIILDEPTNHLDILGIQQLSIILRNYTGAILISTHDEELINSIGTYRKIFI